MTDDDGKALWVPNAMVFGAGIGLTVGAVLGGPAFIATGIIAGAGVGLVIGAAAAAHRPSTARVARFRGRPGPPR